MINHETIINSPNQNNTKLRKYILRIKNTLKICSLRNAAIAAVPASQASPSLNLLIWMGFLWGNSSIVRLRRFLKWGLRKVLKWGWNLVRTLKSSRPWFWTHSLKGFSPSGHLCCYVTSPWVYYSKSNFASQ